jgi:signal recognition particle GTPase
VVVVEEKEEQEKEQEKEQVQEQEKEKEQEQEKEKEKEEEQEEEEDPMSRSGGSTILYHEVQESKLCGVHCVNTVLQGPFFSELDLAAVAAELDKSEMQMGISGALDHRHHYAQLPSFSAPSSSSASPSFSCGLGDEVSSNVSADGNFSIQVFTHSHALTRLTNGSLENEQNVTLGQKHSEE